MILDYWVTSKEAFLTYSATRTSSRPWGLAGGSEGSRNRAEIHRKDGSVETYSMVTGARAIEGETFRLVSATGGGYGDPANRDRSALAADLRNGYVTSEQARRDYGL